MWLFLAGLMVVNLSWIALDHRLSLTFGAAGPMLLVALGTPLALAYGEIRRESFDRLLKILFKMLMVAFFAGLMTQQVNLFSHLLMTRGFPLTDDLLQSWDRMLGFDWNGYVAFMGQWNWSRLALAISYSRLIPLAFVLMISSCIILDRDDRVNEIAFLSMVSGLACVTISACLPSEGAWSSLATDQTKRLLGGTFLADMVDQIRALRGEDPVAFDFRDMQGLANFPSYHTCLAIIVMWCSRGRWYTALLGGLAGLAILAATPVYGGHYLVDLLGGAVVMAVVILLWRRLGPSLSKL